MYLRGSRAVGYAGSRGDGSLSDWDFVVVTTEHGALEEDVHLCNANLEVVLYDEATFLRLVRSGCIWALECIFAPASCRLLEEIDFREALARHIEQTPRDSWLASLRRSVAYESGRKWGQAKRYLVEKGDAYSCRKRMFIAMRFLVYGIEIARTGTLTDLSCANHLWEQLRVHPAATWAELRRAFEPTLRELRTTFHSAAPKTPRYGGARILFQSSKSHKSTMESSFRFPSMRQRRAQFRTMRMSSRPFAHCVRWALVIRLLRFEPA
ncbi:MAG: hypothetical protein U0165_12555 [Polyangiaceae bacterium]